MRRGYAPRRDPISVRVRTAPTVPVAALRLASMHGSELDQLALRSYFCVMHTLARVLDTMSFRERLASRAGLFICTPAHSFACSPSGPPCTISLCPRCLSARGAGRVNEADLICVSSRVCDSHELARSLRHDLGFWFSCPPRHTEAEQSSWMYNDRYTDVGISIVLY